MKKHIIVLILTFFCYFIYGQNVTGFIEYKWYTDSETVIKKEGKPSQDVLDVTRILIYRNDRRISLYASNLTAFEFIDNKLAMGSYDIELRPNKLNEVKKVYLILINELKNIYGNYRFQDNMDNIEDDPRLENGYEYGVSWFRTIWRHDNGEPSIIISMWYFATWIIKIEYYSPTYNKDLESAKQNASKYGL
jgi:hypothetical protein